MTPPADDRTPAETAGSGPARLLVVDDEPALRDALESSLAFEGYEVTTATDGFEALEAVERDRPDLVLLDIMMPRMDGLTAVRRMRSRGDTAPVLMLTARDAVGDRVTGLDVGADDYLVKPYEFRELLARMRAVIRRRDGSAHSVVGTDAVQLDLTTREVVVQGERAQLSAREFALLHALLERPGAILSRDQLESRIYGWGEEVSSNAVDVLIHGMRRKLGAEVIRNVRGLGWRIAAGQPVGTTAREGA
jgi:two-component system OmpR family response regulator/two-component system response regulator QseB